MNYKITAILTSQPEGGYTVTCEELPELLSEGNTVDQVIKNVTDAFAATLEMYADLGRSLPQNIQTTPGSTPTEDNTLQLVVVISESEMKRKTSKKRLKEIQDFYQSLGLDSEQSKYFTPLTTLPEPTEQERPIVFIESGISSDSHGDFPNAGLE